MPRITVELITNKEFSIENRGYNRREVDTFLDEISEELEHLDAELQELSRQDTGDNMKEYSVEKVEQAMREAWGPYYVPRGKRYEEISVIHGIKKG